MENNEPEKISVTEIEILKSDAEKRSNTWHVVAGLLIGPILLCSAWYLSHDIGTVRKVGMGIFYGGSVVFALAFVRFSHYSGKLKLFTQIDSVMIRGVLGPVKNEYRAKYEFARFTTSDFESYKKMHTWGGLLFGAFFALTSWLLTINVFNYFIWE